MQINIQKSAKITKNDVSLRTHHLFVRNKFSDSAQNFGLETTLKPFGLRQLNKSACVLGTYTKLLDVASFEKRIDSFWQCRSFYIGLLTLLIAQNNKKSIYYKDVIMLLLKSNDVWTEAKHKRQNRK